MENYVSPYLSVEHYYKELLKYVDYKLAEYYEATKDLKEEHSLGWALKNTTSESMKYFESAKKQLHQMKQHVIETLPTSIFIPLEHVIETFKLSKFEIFCLYLSISVELDPSFERSIRYFNDTINSPYPTLGLALKICTTDLNDYLSERILINEQSKIFKYFYINVAENHKNQPLISIPLKLDRSIVEFVLNFDTYKISEDFIKLYLPNDYNGQSYFEDIELKLHEFVKQNYHNKLNKNLMFFIHGPKGIGKHTMVYHFCNHYDQTALIVNCKKLIPNDDGMTQIALLSREALLHRATLIFENFEALIEQLEDKKVSLFVESLLNEIRSFSKVSFALSAIPWYSQTEFVNFSIIEVPLNLPNELKRFDIWTDKMKDISLSDDIDLNEISNKFKFTPKQIEKAVKDAHNYMLWDKQDTINNQMLHRANYYQLAHGLNEKAQLINTHYKWKDVVLPTEQFNQLIEACNHVKYKHIVFSKWGFADKLTYGTGLGLLFTGPPGTGKTLAAQVIANELNLEIYRVDLSQIISKYIGETEKNLKVVFDEATYSGAILLFDEGDALFSKRTEVSDSHDKYANVETSYLLQKIESYDGISIVTTNLIGNIDEAFIRRFAFVIHFPFPTPEYRRKIWRNIFPADVPMSKTIDFDYLGNQFELSGGNIKNIALNAAFIAASAQREVTMKDLLISVASEISKTGKSVLASDFGQYAYMLTI